MIGAINKLLAKGAAGQAARQSVRKAGSAFIKDALVPGNKYEALVSYGPEPIYAAMQMASMPDGTSVGERLLVGLEDLGLGMLGSGGGRLLGAGASRAIPGLSDEARSFVNIVGDMGGNMAVAYSPRPQVEKVFNRLGSETQLAEQQEAEILQQRRDAALVEGLIQAGLVSSEGLRMLT